MTPTIERLTQFQSTLFAEAHSIGQFKIGLRGNGQWEVKRMAIMDTNSTSLYIGSMEDTLAKFQEYVSITYGVQGK